MSDSPNLSSSLPAERWEETALSVIHSPLNKVKCPSCGNRAISGAWHLVDILARKGDVDLKCSSCRLSQNLKIDLPPDSLPFFPLERVVNLCEAIQAEIASISKRIQRHVESMPVAGFTTSPLWQTAKWRGMTFRWDPNHPMKVPPIMGLCFEDGETGKELFKSLVDHHGNSDKFEEIRVSIIEGSPPGQKFGYSIHICPDPDSLAAYATAADIVLDPKLIRFFGRWNRLYPIPGSPPLLEAFKAGFEKHEEFLMAPATRREDGQQYFDVKLGLVKHSIEFRKLSDITSEDDLDAMALVMPALITPEKPPAMRFVLR
jgi:hypothetical protein